MNEADVLATTYWHKCTVKRAQKVTEDGWTREKLVDVYTDIPCAVSTGGGSSEGVNDEYVPVQYEDELFTRPEVQILAGDVIICDIFGETFEFQAGEGRRYHSHRQTPLIRKERA